jgi:hypothetical protein
VSVAFALLAVVAVLAMTTVVCQARREATARLALGGTGRGRQAVVRGEALFATGIDRCTVAFDCLMTTKGAASGALEPTSLTLRRRVPAWSGQSLADVVRGWAEGGERVFVEVPVDSLYGPLTAHLSCGHHGVEAEITNRGELRRLVGRQLRSPARPR